MRGRGRHVVGGGRRTRCWTSTLEATLCAVSLAASQVACGNPPAGPKTIAHVDPDATLLGAAGGRAYWARKFSLYWVDDTTPGTQSVSLEGVDWAKRATTFIDSSGVYLVHHNKLDHIRVAPGAGSAVDVRRLDAGEHPAGVVRLGDCLYTVEVDVECNGRGAIVGWPLMSGARCPRYEAPADGFQPIAFTADVQNFYWVDGYCQFEHIPPAHASHSVDRVDRATGAVSVVAVLASGEASPELLQGGTRGVYWRTPVGIRRARVGAGAPETIVDGEVTDLVVDHGTLFYAKGGTVYALDEASAQVRTIASAADARDLLVDARHVYWRTAGGDLVRAPRAREVDER